VLNLFLKKSRSKAFETTTNLAALLLVVQISIHNNERMLLVSKAKQYELNVTPRMLVNDFFVLKQMVVEGLGAAIIPDYMCGQELGSRELIEMLPNWGMLDVDVYALYLKYRANVPKVKVFLDFLKIVFAKRLTS
jgi:LysR family transcriptional regulator AphB